MGEGRQDRARRIIKKFNELGIPLAFEDVLAFSQDGVIARPHIAKAVVEKGYIADYQTVFGEYLAGGKPCAIDKMILTPKEGIQLIHEAGGVAVLAHSVYIGDDLFVRELLAFGFHGSEVWHKN